MIKTVRIKNGSMCSHHYSCKDILQGLTKSFFYDNCNIMRKISWSMFSSFRNLDVRAIRFLLLTWLKLNAYLPECFACNSSSWNAGYGSEVSARGNASLYLECVCGICVTECINIGGYFTQLQAESVLQITSLFWETVPNWKFSELQWHADIWNPIFEKSWLRAREVFYNTYCLKMFRVSDVTRYSAR